MAAVLTDATKLAAAQVRLQGVAGSDDTLNLDVDAIRIVAGTKTYSVSYDGNKYRDSSYAPATISNWCAQCHNCHFSRY